MPEDVELVELPFSVVACTSEEPGFEASTLATFAEDGDGWRSKPAEEAAPQRLVLRVQHSDERRVVHALEILCHETLLAQTVEISLGGGEGDVPASFDESSVVDLGFVTLDSNERSNFEARELKFVPVEQPADYIQLVLQGCHANRHNTHNQVGLVGVRVLGLPSVEVEEQQPMEEGAVVAREDRGSNPTPVASPAKSICSPSAHVPVSKIEINNMYASSNLRSEIPLSPVNALPTHVKERLDTKMRSCVDRLERLKKERASVEDFEAAGKIKEALSRVYALLVCFRDAETKMRKAAEVEDYALASRLKSERDVKREAATQALAEVEQKFVGRIDEEAIVAADLSISTVKDERSFASPKSRTNALSPKKSFLETSTIASHTESAATTEESRDNSASSESQNENGEHPLSGVEGYEELPVPEELSDSGAASSDLVRKIEDLFGSYRTNAFFSKNWLLREAAVAKMALLVPEVCDDATAEKCAETLSSTLEIGLDDKNVQVFLASLILLDESLLQFEASDLPPSKVTPLVSRIVLNLLGKLADSKPKVATSAELALLSLASSSCVDKTSLVHAATKRIRSKESKGGRTVKARLQFLEHLAAEFGKDVAWKRMVDFVKGHHAFEHKDGGVRDAAKSLVVTLMMIHGEEAILDSLQAGESVAQRLTAECLRRCAL